MACGVISDVNLNWQLIGQGRPSEPSDWLEKSVPASIRWQRQHAGPDFITSHPWVFPSIHEKLIQAWHPVTRPSHWPEELIQASDWSAQTPAPCVSMGCDSQGVQTTQTFTWTHQNLNNNEFWMGRNSQTAYCLSPARQVSYPQQTNFPAWAGPDIRPKRFII